MAVPKRNAGALFGYISLLAVVSCVCRTTVEAWSTNNANSKNVPPVAQQTPRTDGVTKGNSNNNGRRDFLGNLASVASVAATGAVVLATAPESAAGSPAATQIMMAAASTGVLTESPAAVVPFGKQGNDKIYNPPLNSLKGKVVVISGASTGLGLESAKRLALAGATVIGTARSTAKGEKALSEIRDYLKERSIDNTSSVYFVTLDLDNLESVRSFPKRAQAAVFGENNNNNPLQIDVLMNNAGVAAIPQREFTPDGFERTFQSNHLGPFVLTQALFPYLNRKSGDARIINVSSFANNFAKTGTEFGLNLGNLNGELEYTSDGWGAYCNTKLENILFTQELQRRADEGGLDWLSVQSLHPGVVGTDIWRNTYVGTKNGNNNKSSLSPKNLASKVFYGSTLTIQEGANTQVYLAAIQKAAKRGAFYDEKGTVGILQGFARDETKAKELWKISEELTGTAFAVR